MTDNPPAPLDDAVLEQLNALLSAGGPAFPFADPPGSRPTRIFPGMTIRDFFAAAALEGCVEKQFSDALLARLGSTEATSAAIAGAAYQIADACLLARRGRVDPLFAAIEERDALLRTVESARDFVANLRVPQDVTQAAWQVMQGSRVLDALNAALARTKEPA